MSVEVFQIAGISFTRFGLGCALALLLYLAVIRLLTRKQAEYGSFITLALLTVPLCWLTSRLLFVAVDFIGHFLQASVYLDEYGDPALALRFWEGGYSLMGALLGALLALHLAEALTGKHTVFRDAAAIAFPLAIALERLAEYGTGVGEGQPVELQWAIDTGLCIESEGYYYWPVCLLEALAMLVLFVLMVIRRIRQSDRVPGDKLRSFLAIFGLVSIVLETLRSDYHMEVHFVKAQMVIALLLVLGCMLVWSRRMKGDTRMELGCWGLTIAAVAGAVIAEFGVDRWDSKLLAYGLLLICVLLIGWMAFSLRDWSTVKRKNF